MFQISFISTGTTFSQTPIMASIAYNLVKNWVKESQTVPEFPVACIYDFSNMYSTIQYFATDKILTRMNELTSILDLMKDSVGAELDWSMCSFPSKFAHKKTNDPLFFMIPIFPRGITSNLEKSEIIELTKILNEISETIENATCQYIVYDLPSIDTMGDNLALIPALLVSNFIVAVVDCTKPNYNSVEDEIRSLTSFVDKTNKIASPKLAINGLVLTHISEKIKSEKWIEKIAESFNIPIIGTITADPHFSTISSKYEIPTEEKHEKKLKHVRDFYSTVRALNEQLNNDDNVRNVMNNQIRILEE
ncbi:MAG: hypothetical protein ACW99A_23800, partial [Candidatus Kariarchaeaceae archaeon]